MVLVGSKKESSQAQEGERVVRSEQRPRLVVSKRVFRSRQWSWWAARNRVVRHEYELRQEVDLSGVSGGLCRQCLWNLRSPSRDPASKPGRPGRDSVYPGRPGRDPETIL